MFPDRLSTLTPGKEYDLKLTAELLHGNSKANVFCPQYHRSKIASYWCVVGLKGEVLAVRKIVLSGSRVSVVIPIKMPGTLPETRLEENPAALNVLGKVSNPNDKLYMNYREDYQQLQQQQILKNKAQQSQEPHEQPIQQQREKDMIQIYLLSDSILGLDDVVDLPFSL